MHNLLSELRNHSVVAVTNVLDVGDRFRIELRYLDIVAAVLCTKAPFLVQGDVVFMYEGNALEIHGNTPKKQALAIQDHMTARYVRKTTKTGQWIHESS